MTDLSDAFDTSGEATDTKDPAIVRLMEKAAIMINHEELVADLETNLKDAKTFLRQIQEVEMPDLMAECGMTNFTHLATGAKVEIKDFVVGSLPKEPDKKEAALNELVSMDTNEKGEETDIHASDLIKTTVTLTFDKRQHNQALSIAAELREKGFDVIVESDVHPSTLQAFARKCLKDGVNIALENLGLYAGKKAKVTPKKGT